MLETKRQRRNIFDNGTNHLCQLKHKNVHYNTSETQTKYENLENKFQETFKN